MLSRQGLSFFTQAYNLYSNKTVGWGRLTWTKLTWTVSELGRKPDLKYGDNGQFRPRKRTEGGHGTMDKITKMLVKVREYQGGQTMAEYALILSAVAVVVFKGYQTIGTTITTLLSSVDGKL
jgi:Flp pilus assembly pilin Flp